MNFDTFEEIQAAFSAAEELRRGGEYDAALDGYVAILEARLSQMFGGGGLPELTAADLTIVERTADLAALLGYRDAADDLLCGMTTQLEQVGNYVGADYAAVKRVHLSLGCGRLDAADRLLRSMSPRLGDIDDIVFSPADLARWESERSWPGASAADRAALLSRLYHVLGWLLADLGQYASALCAFRQGLKHASDGAHTLARLMSVPLRLAAAGALLEKGEMSEARRELERLAPLLDEHVNPGIYVRWLELKGKHSMLCGDYGDAHKHYKRVLVICHLHRFERPALTAALNLAHVLILLNHTGLARELLGATARRAEQLGEASVAHHSYFLMKLAAARSISPSEDDPASPRLEPLPRMATPGGREDAPPSDPRDLPQSANHLSFFEDRALAFQWSLGLGDAEQAAQIYSNMTQTFAASDSSLIGLRLRVMGGILSYFTGDLVSAERRLGECRAELRESGLVPELWQAQRVLGWCWARLRFADDRRRELERENSALLARMADSLPPEYRAVYLLPKWTADEEYIGGELEQLCALRDAAAAGPRLKRPLLRWEMMKRLYALLRHIDRYKDALAKRERASDGAGEQSRDDETFWRRLWAHPRKRATFSFLVLPNCLLVVRMWWLHLDFEVRQVSRINVRELAREWHMLVGRERSRERRDGRAEDDAPGEAESDYLASMVGIGRDFFLDAGEGKSPDRVANILRRMSETLGLGSLLSALPRRVRAITIVPDDSLHGFPFPALIHEGKFLIERYALSLAFESGATRPSPRRRGDGRALVVGVSRGGVAEDGKNFPPLPGVGEEVRSLKGWLSRRRLPTSLLKDEEATRAAVLEQLPGATFVHLACHGIFEPDKPDASGLVLVPASGRAEVLSLRELSGLDLTGLRHIGLSFCWSADNFILPGRWIISLPETVWRAGAQSVLGHLWRVHDSLAVAFSQRFYENALRHDLDEAVRLTQLSCLARELLPDRDALDTSSPVHWAGYNLYGDYGRLRFKGASAARGDSSRLR
jgi:hypothetical protein